MLKTYVPGAAQNSREEAYNSSVAKALFSQIDATLRKAPFSQEVQDMWQKIKGAHTPADVQDVQRLLAQLFRQADKKLTTAHKTLIERTSISYSELVGGASGPVDEELLNYFMHTYAYAVLAPTYEQYQKKTDEIASIYRVPGFQRVLRGYDLSEASLIKYDNSLEALLKDPAHTTEQKRQALYKAVVTMISQKDKELGTIVEQLLAHDMNAARLSPELQQKYISKFHKERSNSAEMKALDELFAKMQIDPKKRKELFDQVFDLSRTTLSFQ